MKLLHGIPWCARCSVENNNFSFYLRMQALLSFPILRAWNKVKVWCTSTTVLIKYYTCIWYGACKLNITYFNICYSVPVSTDSIAKKKNREKEVASNSTHTLDDKSRVLQNIHPSMYSTFRIYDFNYIVLCVCLLLSVDSVLQPRLLSPFQWPYTSGKTRISLL